MKRPLFTVCLCLVTAAALRYFGVAGAPPGEAVRPPDGQELVVTGQVCQKENEKFYLDSVQILEMIQEAGVSRPDLSIDNRKLSCSYPEGEEGWKRKLKIGETVTLEGKWHNYARATNPGEFDSAAYYASLHIAGRMTDSRVILAGEKYSRTGEALYLLRSYFEERLYRVFPRKEAGILCTMLLGEKAELDPAVKKLYQRNGIIHILSISGLHITLIGMGLYRLLRRLGMSVAAAAVSGCAALLLYGFMTGMSISACRAIGMYCLRMVSLLCGRTYDLLTACGVLAAAMVLRNPMYLSHAGFLLSFSSVLGIGVLYPLLSQNLGGRAWGREALLAGGSVTLATLPVQLWFYYEAPVWSVFLNLCVLPCVGAVVVVGFLVMLVPGLGILGTADCLILAGFEKLCLLAERLPGHVWNPGRPGLWQIALYYGGLLLAAWLPAKLRKAWRLECGKDGSLVVWVSQRLRGERTVCGLRHGLKFAQLAAVALLTVFLGWRPGGGSSITFLDVGQGDCCCLRMRSGEVYLFDCGSVSRRGVGEYVLLPYLKYNGIRRLNAVFLSHADRDHTGGIAELLRVAEEEHIVIDQLVLPGGEGAETLTEFGELLEAAEIYAAWRPLPVRKLCEGDAWNCGNAVFVTLNPPKHREGMEGNAASLCFYIELRDQKVEPFEILLTGDIEGEGEEQVIRQLAERGIGGVSLLKTAHHGSRYSTSLAFLEQVRPKAAVISCGRDNVYGHPHEETLARLEEAGAYVCRTDECGAVTFSLKGKEGSKLRIYRSE